MILLYIFPIYFTIQLSIAELFEWRISHGKESIPHEFPFLVSIQKLYPEGYEHDCGGSIIAPRWILTAGHCWGAEKMKILAGGHNLSAVDKNVQSRKVKQFIPHPKYNKHLPSIQMNDIALIKLDKDLELNNYVDVISLPDAKAELSENAIISGWGLTSEEPSLVLIVNLSHF